jgi:hypothetical protein
MSSPFLSPEPASIETPQPPKQEKPKLPSELQAVLNAYQTVVENPSDQNVLWNFVKIFFTFLESKANLVIPIIQGNAEGGNLMLVLKNAGITSIPWSVYNAFLTLSNIGSSIAQKEPKDDKDKFYLMYVMLSVDNNSPTYSFTELLQTLQSQGEETMQVYNNLNDKFLQAFSKYENPSEKSKDAKSDDVMSRTVTIPYLNSQVQMKWILLMVVVLILLVVLGLGFFYYYGENKSTSEVMVNVGGGSDVDSIMGFASE